MSEPIKIQIGKIYMNRTRKYLFPVIKQYGTDFVYRINNMFKVAVGIGDIITERCGFNHEKHLFILVDSKLKSSEFKRSLLWLRKHPAFEDDYVYGNIHKSRFHMIVVKIPDDYIPSLQNFRESKFSKMYLKKDILKLFSIEKKTGSDKLLYKNIIDVLIHNHNYKVQFAKQIKEHFDIPSFTEKDIGDEVEFDLPIDRIEEIFNYKHND